MFRTSLALSLLLLVSACSSVHFGLLEPTLEKLEDCTEKRALAGADLKARSTTSTLEYSIFGPDYKDSVDYNLLKQFGLAGLIMNTSIPNDASEVLDEAEVRFTGNLYLRLPSLPERHIGGSDAYASYEVECQRRFKTDPLFGDIVALKLTHPRRLGVC